MSAIFSKNLKKIRQEFCISQKELGDELGVSQTTIYQWENGNEPSIEKLESLADFFHITVDQLLSYTKNPTPRFKTKEEEELIANFGRLNNANKTRLLGYCKALVDTQKSAL